MIANPILGRRVRAVPWGSLRRIVAQHHPLHPADPVFGAPIDAEALRRRIHRSANPLHWRASCSLRDKSFLDAEEEP
jgi:hypothetical protein